MIDENVQHVGTLCIQVFDENGKLKEEREVNNLITNLGLAHIASRLKDATSAVMSHMAIGTGTTAAAVTQTTLVTEAGRVAYDSSALVTTNVANDSIQYTATFPSGTGTGAITEAGLFNASGANAGTMFSRTVFGVVTKQATDSLVITWKIANV